MQDDREFVVRRLRGLQDFPKNETVAYDARKNQLRRDD
jgi:hypothetical protein